MKKLIKNLITFLVIILFVVTAYYLYDNFRERTQAEKIAEIIHLEDSRVSSEKLQKYLNNPDMELRARATLAVGRIADRKSPTILYNLLSDSSIDIAVTAAFAIGLTGNKESAARLLDRALDLPSAVTARAVESAGRLADTSMVDVIESLAGYLSHPSPDVREAACYGLTNAGAKSKGPQILQLLKTEEDSLVRISAVYALARMGLDEATPLFIDYLADPDPYLRSLAVRGLSRSTQDEARHYLAISLNDSDPRVVAQAIYGLRSAENNKFIKNLVKKLRDERDENLTLELIRALQMLKSDEGVELVETFFSTRPTDNIIAASLEYLAAVKGDKAINLIDSLLNSTPSPYVRAACVRAYGAIDKNSIISRLGTLFADEDPMVRAEAFGELTRLDSGNVDYYIKKALADPDYVLTTLAVDKIGERKDKAYLPTLKTMFSRGREIDVDIRRTIIGTMPVFLPKDNPNETAREILIEGTLDKEYIVRKDAAKICKDIFDEDYDYLVPPAVARISASEIEKGLEKYKTNPYALIFTNKGEIEMELYFDVAPVTVLTFIKAARDGHFDGLTFHRVIPNFVVQGGDPRGDGYGGTDFFIRCEYSDEPYQRGTVGIATSGRDTGELQFFIALSPQPHLEARYTVFGQVLEGMEVVDQISHGDLIEKIIIRENLP